MENSEVAFHIKSTKNASSHKEFQQRPTVNNFNSTYTMKNFLFAISCLLLNPIANAQTSQPFSIKLEPVIPAEFTGIQSYAWAKEGDKVVLIGGRTDGLHRRQPFAAFGKKYNNTDIVVIDLKKEKVWKKSILKLPPTIAEQLQSSNMEFFLQGNELLIIGGYGYSETKKNHITHPAIIRVKVKELINAIIKNQDILPFVNQLADERMAVTGGRLNKLGNFYYLVGGQRFDGRYNPHGRDHGPGFSQEYTNQIRKFSIGEKNGRLEIENYSAITDSLQLHRRDYNLLPQIDTNGNEILSIYSGVFQYGKDIPFTTVIDINEIGHHEVANFHQLFSHYHTATLPVYNTNTKTLYSVFFGGIAQHYKDSSGKMVTDSNVPFVKHISVVERNQNSIKEYLLQETMPGYFGAAAEFIPGNETLYTNNGILNLNKLGKKSTMIGYIIGGIDSRAPNVFWSNEAEPSRASPVIWKVYFTKTNSN